MWVQSMGQEDSLEKEMTTQLYSCLKNVRRTEEPGGLQSMGSQRVRCNLATKQQWAPRHMGSVFIYFVVTWVPRGVQTPHIRKYKS